MEIVLKTSSLNIERIKKVLFEHDVVSRANIIVRDASAIGKEGFYIRIIGNEEQCREALEISKEIAEEVKGDEREAILKKLKEEDEKAMKGIERLFD